MKEKKIAREERNQEKLCSMSYKRTNLPPLMLFGKKETRMSWLTVIG